MILITIMMLSAGAAAAPDWVYEIPRIKLFEFPSPETRDSESNLAHSPSFTRNPDSFRIAVQIDSKQKSKFYALRLKGSLEYNNLAIEINGKSFDQIPAFSSEGLYYRISPVYLVEGENIINVSTTSGRAPVITETECFSLENSAEEAHFGRLFSDTAIRTQPPAHADQSKYDAIHYDLVITLNMSAAVIPDAVLTMDGLSLDSTLSQVILDFDDNGGSMNVTAVDQGPSTSALTYTHNSGDNRLYIDLPAAVPAGNSFTVRIFYSGTPSTGGAFANAYSRTTHSGTPLIFTFSEPYKARNWWPCKDIPEDKATMDLHITCPTEYTAISNGSLSGPVDNGDGTHTFDWSESFNIATYLVSICCTNYTAVTGTYTALDGVTTMEVAHYVYPEDYDYDSQGITGTISAMEFYAETFGEYPFLTEKYYTATHADTAGMEHQTCTSMPTNDVGIDAGEGRRNIHELAHQWFGDLITMEHFDHLWLNEGFATYCEALYYEHRDGTTAYHNYVNNWSTSDSYPIISSSADNFSGSIVYRKGAWVLHMLRKVLGDPDFFQAIRNYVADPDLRYGTALTDDLRVHCEALYGEDLSWFFDQWLLRAYRPSYEWSWASHSSGSDTILDLEITQIQSGDFFTMPIEFKVESSTGATQYVSVMNNAAYQTFEVNVGEISIADVTFDPDNWILENHTEISDAPDAPTLSSVTDVSGADDEVLVTWEAVGSATLDGYELYYSEDITSWVLAADKSVLGISDTSYVVTGLTTDTDYYFKIRAMSPTNAGSEFSDTYGCRPTSAAPAILIVDGHDRGSTDQPEDTYYFADAVDSSGFAFDTCDNAVLGVSVNLTDYDAVMWMLGEESTMDQTFSSTERALTETFLDGGGNLFVSGAEIGWDIGRIGYSTTEEIAFYNNYLKAVYNGDDSNTHQVQGETGSIFEGVTVFNFDDGSWKQDIDYPDQLGTSGGSTSCMTYVGGTADTAGIQYSDTFKVVHFGFPFESIIDRDTRLLVMARIIDFFDLGAPPEPPVWDYVYRAVPTDGALILEWTAASDVNIPITYNIYASTASGNQNFTAPDASTTDTAYVLSGLTNGLPYYFVIRAENSAGIETDNTNEITATPQANMMADSIYNYNFEAGVATRAPITGKPVGWTASNQSYGDKTTQFSVDDTDPYEGSYSALMETTGSPTNPNDISIASLTSDNTVAILKDHTYAVSAAVRRSHSQWTRMILFTEGYGIIHTESIDALDNGTGDSGWEILYLHFRAPANQNAYVRIDSLVTNGRTAGSDACSMWVDDFNVIDLGIETLTDIYNTSEPEQYGVRNRYFDLPTETEVATLGGSVYTATAIPRRWNIAFAIDTGSNNAAGYPVWGQETPSGLNNLTGDAGYIKAKAADTSKPCYPALNAVGVNFNNDVYKGYLHVLSFNYGASGTTLPLLRVFMINGDFSHYASLFVDPGVGLPGDRMWPLALHHTTGFDDNHIKIRFDNVTLGAFGAGVHTDETTVYIDNVIMNMIQ